MAADMSHAQGQPHPPQTARALAALERERKEKAEAKSTMWAFIWTLFVFKIATVAVIWYVASGSRESTGLIVVTTWFWLPIPIIAIGGPLLYRWRLIRQRRRRAELRRAEWMQVGETASGSDGASRPEVHVIVQPIGEDGRPPS